MAPLHEAGGERWITPRSESGGGRWIRTTEGVSQQIYSLPPLAAWVSLRNFWLVESLRAAPLARRVQNSCTDTKNPAMFNDIRVSAICITKTAYFCGSQGASQPFTRYRSPIDPGRGAPAPQPPTVRAPNGRSRTTGNGYQNPSLHATLEATICHTCFEMYITYQELSRMCRMARVLQSA